MGACWALIATGAFFPIYLSLMTGIQGVDRKLVGVDIGGAPMTDEGALNDFWPIRASGASEYSTPFISAT